MRLFPNNFYSCGFEFTLIRRYHDLALLLKSDRNTGEESYEVVFIVTHPDRKVCGNLIPAGEYMPTASEWGVKGWTYQQESRALSCWFTQIAKFDGNYPTSPPEEDGDIQSLHSPPLTAPSPRAIMNRRKLRIVAA